jgi:cytochrome b561
MKLTDTSSRYGFVSRINHWLGGAVVVALLGVGLYFHEMPRGDERLYWMQWHIGVGMVTIAFVAFRVLWRLLARVPDPYPQTPALQRLTRIVHGVLLAGIAALVVTGPLIVWSAGRAISVFGWFELASPLGETKALHEALEGAHALVSRVLLVAIVLHVVATLKHTFVDRGGMLSRMLGGLRAGA